MSENYSRINALLTAIFALATALLGYFSFSSKLTTSRPPTEQTKAVTPIGNQNISARLWEDPFGAVRAVEKGAMRETGIGELARETGRRTGAKNKVILLGMMVEGGAYPEEVEVRRRIRYALQTAMLSAGLYPEDRGHLGVTEITWPTTGDIQSKNKGISPNTITFEGIHTPEQKPTKLTLPFEIQTDANPPATIAFEGILSTATGDPKARDSSKLTIPFEWFVGHAGVETEERVPVSVLALWLSEENFSDYPLGRVGAVFMKIKGTSSASTALIGPRSSDTLRAMREDTITNVCGDKDCTPLDPSTIRIYSSQASAPDAVISDKLGTELIQFKWSDNRNNIWRPGTRLFEDSKLADGQPRFQNLTTPDDALARMLWKELEARGLKLANHFHSEDTADRVVLIAEGDTFYGRSMKLCFQAAGEAHRSNHENGPINISNPPTNILSFAYLRGLDGKTARSQGENIPK